MHFFNSEMIHKQGVSLPDLALQRFGDDARGYECRSHCDRRQLFQTSGKEGNTVMDGSIMHPVPYAAAFINIVRYPEAEKRAGSPCHNPYFVVLLLVRRLSSRGGRGNWPSFTPLTHVAHDYYWLPLKLM